MKKILFISLLFSGFASAQMVTKDTSFVGWFARMTRPISENDSNTVIVSLPGRGGEANASGGGTGKLISEGPHTYFPLGTGVGTRVQLGNGYHYPILISLQTPDDGNSTTASVALHDRLLAIASRFRVRKRGFYLATLSQGNRWAMLYLSYQPTAGDNSYGALITAIFNTQGVVPNATGIPNMLPYPQRMGHWAKIGSNGYGGKIFSLDQIADGGRDMQTYHKNMIDSVGTGKVNLVRTQFGANNHCCFAQLFNPSITNWSTSNPEVNAVTYGGVTGMNWIQWLLRQGDTTPAFGVIGDPPPNAPIANAGPDFNVIPPTSTATLDGSNSSGTITSYLWLKLTGPSGGNITSASSATTGVTSLTTGTYSFQLSVSDGTTTSRDTIVVTVATPAPCIARAGSDQVIPFGTGAAYLDGSTSTGATSYSWRRTTSVGANTYKANVRNGTSAVAEVLYIPTDNTGYNFELTITGSGGCISTDIVNVRTDFGTMPPQNVDAAGYHTATAGDVTTYGAQVIAGSSIIITGANKVTGKFGSTKTAIEFSNWSATIGNNVRVFIVAGKYEYINIHCRATTFTSIVGNPAIITNLGGQVETMQFFLTNAHNVKVTGKYVAGVSGHPSYLGHAGGYAWSRGKYGIYVNRGWDAPNGFGMLLNGTEVHDIEFEFIELGNGNFANFQMKEPSCSDFAQRPPPFNDIVVHDFYNHDSHGEGWYLGETTPACVSPSRPWDSTHLFNRFRFYNNRTINSGNENFQFNEQQSDNVVYNNIFINGATNWRSTFQNSQDNGMQYALRNTRNAYRNNINLGGGTKSISLGIGLLRETNANDTIHIANNIFKYFFGEYQIYSGKPGCWPTNTPGATVVCPTPPAPIPNAVIKVDSNFFGGAVYRSSEVYTTGISEGTNTTQLLYTIQPPATKFLIRNNVYDGSKSTLVTTGSSGAGENATIIQSGNTVAQIANPAFVNSGFDIGHDWTKGPFMWMDSIRWTWKDEFGQTGANVNWKQPFGFALNDTALFYGKYYRSKIANNTHVPRAGITDAYWEICTWSDGVTTYFYPPEDYRLYKNNPYRQRNIGLLDYVDSAQANQSPVSNAGDSYEITLPTHTVPAIGDLSYDNDGFVSSFLWTKQSGPAAHEILNPTASQTLIRNMVAGTYVFNLQVTDNLGATSNDTMSVVVNPEPNNPPTANAGTDKTITLPTSSISQTGSGNDGDGTITSYLWTKISGPAAFNIVSPTSATTTINGLDEGDYIFSLTVTDDDGATAQDAFSIKVNEAVPPNQPPVSNAGANQSITLPVKLVVVSGSASFDPDGTIAAWLWTQVSGPTTASIVSPTTSGTTIDDLQEGTYNFNLRVQDNLGDFGNSSVTITVIRINKLPEAFPGASVQLNLPTNSTTLIGSGTDEDGTIVSYAWYKASGPSTYTIASPSSSTTGISNLVAGTYQFGLIVTDNDAAKDTSFVTVLVNTPPTVNFGLDRTTASGNPIIRPKDSVHLVVTASDAQDGSNVSILITQISGTGGIIENPTSSSVTITGLSAGSYLFRATVTDQNGAQTYDDIFLELVYANEIRSFIITKKKIYQ